MRELIIFLETLGNLASIPRSGGILFAGLKPSDVDTIAEHSYKTACIALLLAKIVKKIKFLLISDYYLNMQSLMIGLRQYFGIPPRVVQAMQVTLKQTSEQ